MDIDSSLPQPKSSVVALVKKVRDGDFIQQLLEFFGDWALVFKWISSIGDILC